MCYVLASVTPQIGHFLAFRKVQKLSTLLSRVAMPALGGRLVMRKLWISLLSAGSNYVLFSVLASYGPGQTSRACLPHPILGRVRTSFKPQGRKPHVVLITELQAQPSFTSVSVLFRGSLGDLIHSFSSCIKFMSEFTTLHKITPD